MTKDEDDVDVMWSSYFISGCDVIPPAHEACAVEDIWSHGDRCQSGLQGHSRRRLLTVPDDPDMRDPGPRF